MKLTIIMSNGEEWTIKDKLAKIADEDISTAFSRRLSNVEIMMNDGGLVRFFLDHIAAIHKSNDWKDGE
jgi:hypothetical protein